MSANESASHDKTDKMIKSSTYHINNTFIPSFNDLSHADTKGKGFLSGVFGGPKLFRQITIFAISGAMNRDILTLGRLYAITRFQD